MLTNSFIYTSQNYYLKKKLKDTHRHTLRSKVTLKLWVLLDSGACRRVLQVSRVKQLGTLQSQLLTAAQKHTQVVLHTTQIQCFIKINTLLAETEGKARSGLQQGFNSFNPWHYDTLNLSQSDWIYITRLLQKTKLWPSKEKKVWLFVYVTQH